MSPLLISRFSEGPYSPRALPHVQWVSIPLIVGVAAIALGLTCALGGPLPSLLLQQKVWVPLISAGSVLTLCGLFSYYRLNKNRVLASQDVISQPKPQSHQAEKDALLLSRDNSSSLTENNIGSQSFGVNNLSGDDGKQSVLSKPSLQVEDINFESKSNPHLPTKDPLIHLMSYFKFKNRVLVAARVCKDFFVAQKECTNREISKISSKVSMKWDEFRYYAMILNKDVSISWDLEDSKNYMLGSIYEEQLKLRDEQVLKVVKHWEKINELNFFTGEEFIPSFDCLKRIPKEKRDLITSFKFDDATKSQEVFPVLPFFPNLTSIEIYRCSDEILSLFPDKLQRLSLSISFQAASDFYVTTEGLVNLAERCQKLTYLNLLFMPNDLDIAPFAEKCHNLTQLITSNRYSRHFASHCKKLTHLSLFIHAYLARGVESLLDFAQNSPHIKFIALERPHIEEIKTLAAFPALESLFIVGLAANTSEKEVNEALENLPKLKHFGIDSSMSSTFVLLAERQNFSSLHLPSQEKTPIPPNLPKGFIKSAEEMFSEDDLALVPSEFKKSLGSLI